MKAFLLGLFFGSCAVVFWFIAIESDPRQQFRRYFGEDPYREGAKGRAVNLLYTMLQRGDKRFFDANKIANQFGMGLELKHNNT